MMPSAICDNHVDFEGSFALAFLYRTVEPVEVLALLARCCRCVGLGNVFYDELLFVKQPEMARASRMVPNHEFGGFRPILFPTRTATGSISEVSRCDAALALLDDGRQGDRGPASLRFCLDRQPRGGKPFGKAISVVAVKARFSLAGGEGGCAGNWKFGIGNWFHKNRTQTTGRFRTNSKFPTPNSPAGRRHGGRRQRVLP
jgi:hypothetical protein